MTARRLQRTLIVCLGAITLCSYAFLTMRNPALKEIHRRNNNVKYILQWDGVDLPAFNFMGKGHSAFIDNKCTHRNCFVTDDRAYLEDLVDYDAIVFHGREIDRFDHRNLPQVRAGRQKYVFATMESAHNYPVCNKILDDFFNWTWTYRLDSDVRWGYITVFDLFGNVVAPKIDMKWPDLKPIDETTKKRLAFKKHAAAWFVSNCKSLSNREIYAKELSKKLIDYGRELHIFGACGKHSCPRRMSNTCNEMLARNYFFYLAFENSFAEDYVTEKLLTALNNFAVPVVRGGANYSRYLPPGSFLDASELTPGQLAARIQEIILTPELYQDFFRWRNHYVYMESSDNRDVCALCSALNDDAMMSRQTTYHDFRAWWNPKHTTCKR